MEDMIKLRDEILGTIEANKDDRVKELGDRVKVWDGSGNKDKNTSKQRSGIDPLFIKNEAIVIETDCKVEIRGILNTTYLLDLLLKFPTGEEVYCCSEFVKRVDNASK